MKTKRKAGGGRKKKYGEPTKEMKFRCPESKVKDFRVFVNEKLKTYINISNNG